MILLDRSGRPIGEVVLGDRPPTSPSPLFPRGFEELWIFDGARAIERYALPR